MGDWCKVRRVEVTIVGHPLLILVPPVIFKNHLKPGKTKIPTLVKIR